MVFTRVFITLGDEKKEKVLQTGSSSAILFHFNVFFFCCLFRLFILLKVFDDSVKCNVNLKEEKNFSKHN